MNSNNHEKTERFVHQALRGLPARPAPSTLESRVRAEIERRAALPWWRKNFSFWPVAARAVFFATAGGITAAVVWATAGLTLVQAKAAVAPELHWLQVGRNLFNTAGDVVATLINSIPPMYLYGAAALVVALYVALFGLGAAAYRTLYASD